MTILPSGLPEHLADGEDLARFLTSSGQFNAMMAKPSAFMPNPSDEATSVFRHGAKPVETLWQIGRDHAAGERTLHGAAIFKAADVRAVQLAINASEPPPRHADITAWPSIASDPGEEKAKRKEVAMLLAQRAALLLR